MIANVSTKVCCILAGMSLLLFLSRLCFRPPGKLQSLLAGIFGAPVGALATVQAIRWPRRPGLVMKSFGVTHTLW